MTTRDRILVVLLWLSVLAQATWVGGTLYQMLVIVPMGSAAPPESGLGLLVSTFPALKRWAIFGMFCLCRHASAP